MHSNELLLSDFYGSFQNKNYATMQKCYSEKAEFNDEVFKNLNAEQVRSMWEMLIKRGRDLQLEFNNIRADDTTGSAEWTATYTFSKTKRKVVNHIQASFIFEDGKILRHTDRFNFYKWSKQALGFRGLLLGWTDFFKEKVQKLARKNLEDFMRQAPAQ